MQRQFPGRKFGNADGDSVGEFYFRRMERRLFWNQSGVHVDDVWAPVGHGGV